MSPYADPFLAVAALEGVGSAAAHARDAIDALLRHRAMRRQAPRVAAISALRGALASAELEGVDLTAIELDILGGIEAGPSDHLDDPIVQGALRVTAEVPAQARVWDGAPLQALARLHTVAARDLQPPDDLGRPRPGVDMARLDQLVRLATTTTAAPSVVVAAIVHGELLALQPFPTANGLVARAVERLVLVARGVDTKAAAVPEQGHLVARSSYERLLVAYQRGTPEGVAAWVRHCCEAYATGAEAGLAIAQRLIT